MTNEPQGTDPGRPLDLHELGSDLLDQARGSRAGRSARTLVAGPGLPLKQVLLGLEAGGRLQDHVAPGPATLVCLQGEVSLTCGEDRWTVPAGSWVPIPRERHGLEAVTDSVAMLTVAPEQA